MIKNIFEKARRIAEEAHKGQTRKGDGSAYIGHPVAVAKILIDNGFSDEDVAAGYVHDVLEDTDYPPEQLKSELGDKVYEIVLAVTNDDSLSWEDKKAKYIESVKNGPEGAKAVCVTDKIHNLSELIAEYQKEGDAIWSRFNRGKNKKLWFEESVLKMLKETFDHPLVDRYETLLNQAKESCYSS